MFAQVMKYSTLAVVTVLILGGISWGGSIALQSVFGVAQANVERDIFEESQSYVQGTQRDLSNLRLEYLEAETETRRAAIRDVILHRISEFRDRDRLTPDLQEFIRELEQQERN